MISHAKVAPQLTYKHFTGAINAPFIILNNKYI